MTASILRTVFRKDRTRSQAETIHAALAEQARAPEFFESGGAPDSPEGRFDVLTLHLFFAIDRLRRDSPQPDRLIRLLQEVFFERLDSALREMGVGDLSVGRKVRTLAEAFYGRCAAYEKAAGDSHEALAAALARNIIGADDAKAGDALAEYFRAARDELEKTPSDDLAPAFARLGAVSRRILTQVAA